MGKDTNLKENFTITTNVPEMLGVKETAEKFCISQHYAKQLALSGAGIGHGKILINAQDVVVLSRYILICKVVNI